MNLSALQSCTTACLLIHRMVVMHCISAEPCTSQRIQHRQVTLTSHREVWGTPL